LKSLTTPSVHRANSSSESGRPLDQWDRRDAQWQVEDGGVENPLRSEKRHLRAVEHEASREHIAPQRLTTKLRLPVQEVERGEADALIEVGHLWRS
jgi:hypothetical protein